VATAVWMIFVLLSTPTCAFIPKWRVGQGNFPLSRSQIRT